MFRLQPIRDLEDAFVNTHNKELTLLLGCNNNVMAGMNGQAVLYVTSYNTKGTQKEEREMFETISRSAVRTLKKQID